MIIWITSWLGGGGGGGETVWPKTVGFYPTHSGFLPQGMLQAGLGLAPNYQ